MKQQKMKANLMKKKMKKMHKETDLSYIFVVKLKHDLLICNKCKAIAYQIVLSLSSMML